MHQSRSLAFVGQNSHSMMHLDTEPEEQQNSQYMSLGHESFNQSEKISNVQQSLGKKSNTAAVKLYSMAAHHNQR